MLPRHFSRLNLLLFLVALLVGAVQQFLPVGLGRLGWALTAISVLVAVNYLWQRGRMVQSWWRSGTYLFFSGGIVAALARMQHWSNARMIETAVLLGFPLYYLAWVLFGKPVRRLNDVLKLAWVSIAFPLSWALRAGHLVPQDWQFYLQYGCSVLLYYIYYDFVMAERDMQKALRHHWDFEQGREQDPENEKDASE